MYFFIFIVCAISNMEIGASAIPVTKGDLSDFPVPVELAGDGTTYLLPKKLQEGDEINVTGVIDDIPEMWWAVKLLTDSKEDIVCEVKSNRTSNTITINSVIEVDMKATEVFLDSMFIIVLKIKSTNVYHESSKKTLSISFGETIVENTCEFATSVLEKIKFISFEGNIKKVDELHFKLA